MSVIRVEDIPRTYDAVTLVQDYYSISLKRNFQGKLRYGQQQYDFDEGVLVFLAPGQVFRIEHGPDETPPQSGWLLLVHPDFFWNTPLARSIGQYEFFSYAVAEALFLSDKEEAIIVGILQQIRDEYHANIDAFSQGIIIALLEAFLQYAQRFYQRQFLTRRISNHQLLHRFGALLDEWFAREDLVREGLPTVTQVAAALHVSPGYLGSLLRVLTGQSTQQHIQKKQIEKAKQQLSTTDLSVSEIAYSLGFGHPQSFSKLFKTKTKQSPLEFRQSFN